MNTTLYFILLVCSGGTCHESVPSTDQKSIEDQYFDASDKWYNNKVEIWGMSCSHSGEFVFGCEGKYFLTGKG
jgi:hypothetical protein